MDMIWAIIRTTFKAEHRWKECNLKEVEFLKHKHHHEFNVEVRVEQKHTQRDVEYICFQSWLDSFLSKLRINDESCEQIAEIINQAIKVKYPDRLIITAIEEDGHYGALVEPRVLREHEANLAWLAGIIDGEGSIYLTKNFRPCIYIGNYNKDMILNCYAIVEQRGISTNKLFIEKSTPNRPLKKPFYRFAVTGLSNIFNLLSLVEPYLIGKKRQSELLKEYCNQRIQRNKQHKPSLRKKFASYDGESEATRLKLQQLNDSKDRGDENDNVNITVLK